MKNPLSRIQKNLPDPEEVVARVQRELPDTDRDRYDIAFERGRARARSGLLVGGLAIGSMAGAGVMWLLDPERGRGRRAQLADRLTALKNDLSQKAAGRTEDLQNRAQGFAIETGIKDPPASSLTADPSPSDYGVGYREGFGRTEEDPTAPGHAVDDPLRPAEVARYGSSGPIAGAGHEDLRSESTSTERPNSAL